MTRSRLWPAAALAAGLFLAAGGTSAQPPRHGQPGPRPGPGPLPVLPAELPLVPKSSAAFISVRVADVLDHPDLRPVLEQLKKHPEALGDITEALGVSPHEMDRLTLFWPGVSPRGPGEPVVVVTTRQPYNEARVLKALRAEPVFDEDFDRHRHEDHRHGPHGAPAIKQGKAAGGEEKSATKPARPSDPEQPPAILKKSPDKVPDFPPQKSKEPEKPSAPEDDPCAAAAPPVFAGDPLFYAIERGPFQVLFLVDDTTLVFLPNPYQGTITPLALLGQLLKKKGTGPLAEAIAAGGMHTLTAGVYLPPLFREFDRKIPPELAPYTALTAARTATLAGDLGKTTRLTLRLNFDDAAAARRAAPVLEEGIKVLAEKVGEQVAEIKEARRPRDAAMVPLLEGFAAGLKKAEVKFEGTAVVAAGEVDITQTVAKLLGDAVRGLTARKQLAARSTNLKQIGLALHNYESANGRLPANVYGAKGEPLLSWRVQILPYLEQGDSYRQFKLDEPWDSENNKKFIEKMPDVFTVPERDAPKGQTFYQAFASPDPRKVQPKGGLFTRSWLVEGEKNGVSLAHIQDGTSNTIGVVEARNGVIWTKPDDLPFGEKLPPLGGEKADRFLALFLDGSVRTIPANIKPDILRILIGRDDGQVVPDFDEDDGPVIFPIFGRRAAATARAQQEMVEQLFLIYQEERRRLEETRRALQVEEEVALLEARRAEELALKGTPAEATEAKARAAAARERVEVRRREVQVCEARLADIRRQMEREGVAPAEPANRPISEPPTRPVGPGPEPKTEPKPGPGPGPNPGGGAGATLERLGEEVSKLALVVQLNTIVVQQCENRVKLRAAAVQRAFDEFKAGTGTRAAAQKAEAELEEARAETARVAAELRLAQDRLRAAEREFEKARADKK